MLTEAAHYQMFNSNFITELDDVLKLNGWKYTRNVKRKHPAIKDRQNAFKFYHAKNEVALELGYKGIQKLAEYLLTLLAV